MLLRQIGGAGGELDVPGVADQRGQKQQAVGDVLGALGEVLADEGIVKAEFVGEDDGLAVFAQRIGGAALERVHGHGEVAESHGVSPQGGVGCSARPCVVSAV